MTHGNVTTHIGTCQTCGLENVEVHTVRHDEGWTTDTCVDEFTCFATWQAQPRLHRRRYARR